MKKTVGIISSFDVLCGNATYSDALVSTLKRRGFNVKRIALPVAMQKSKNQAYLNDILNQVKGCDIVNIQFEMGLWGDSPKQAFKNIQEVLKYCPPDRTSAEIHRVQSHYSSFFSNLRFSVNTLGKRKIIHAFKNAFLISIKTRMLFKSYSKIFKALYNKNVRIITHSYKDQSLLNLIHGVDSITHPIMWSEEILDRNANGSTEPESKEDSEFSIGVFGYVQPRKNLSLALKAFKLLLDNGDIPKNSRFKIFGGYHPEAAGYGQTISSSAWEWGTFPPDWTIKMLDEEIMELNLSSCTDWYVRANDEDFASNVSSVDVVVIPYTEVGQSGSGVTSHAIQFARKYVMSDTKMTEQHSAMCDGQIICFDVNSVVSCASAIKASISQKKIARYKNQFSHENLVNLISFNGV